MNLFVFILVLNIAIAIGETSSNKPISGSVETQNGFIPSSAPFPSAAKDMTAYSNVQVNFCGTKKKY